MAPHYLLLIVSSKIALTSPANSSKLAPMLATKPPMQMGGFFIATQRRKLAFVSWGAIKKAKQTLRVCLEGFG
jgi:hypothetical protein